MAGRVIPVGWLPESNGVQRIIMHWTAGGYVPTPFDVQHYHFLISGAGKATRGPKSPGQYLPHCRNLNTGSVGLSICAMAGAVQGRLPYKVPITNLQWERACQAAAEILFAYDLEVSERTLLCHSEAERVYGKVQRGKWDVDALWDPRLDPEEIHAQMRKKANWYLDRLKNLPQA